MATNKKVFFAIPKEEVKRKSDDDLYESVLLPDAGAEAYLNCKFYKSSIDDARRWYVFSIMHIQYLLYEPVMILSGAIFTEESFDSIGKHIESIHKKIIFRNDPVAEGLASRYKSIIEAMRLDGSGYLKCKTIDDLVFWAKDINLIDECQFEQIKAAILQARVRVFPGIGLSEKQRRDIQLLILKHSSELTLSNMYELLDLQDKQADFIKSAIESGELRAEKLRFYFGDEPDYTLKTDYFFKWLMVNNMFPESLILDETYFRNMKIASLREDVAAMPELWFLDQLKDHLRMMYPDQVNNILQHVNFGLYGAYLKTSTLPSGQVNWTEALSNYSHHCRNVGAYTRRYKGLERLLRPDQDPKNVLDMFIDKKDIKLHDYKIRLEVGVTDEEAKYGLTRSIRLPLIATIALLNSSLKPYSSEDPVTYENLCFVVDEVLKEFPNRLPKGGAPKQKQKRNCALMVCLEKIVDEWIEEHHEIPGAPELWEHLKKNISKYGGVIYEISGGWTEVDARLVYKAHTSSMPSIGIARFQNILSEIRGKRKTHV